MKLINNWLNEKVKPRKSDKEGNGEFAIKDIKKDEIIAIFGGHVMRRVERNNLPENIKYLPIGIDEEMFIGPKSIEEIDDADWFNHSCEPNAGIKGQIMLVAMRDIKMGEEITFDYVMSCSQNDEKRILFKCGCGLSNCRKEITNLDWKNPELQQKYKGYFSYFVQRNIDGLKNDEIK
jgi:SET domain-containing protein